MVELHFSCSECNKMVFNEGIFLQGGSVREGFCAYKCAYVWLGRQIKKDSREVKGERNYLNGEKAIDAIEKRISAKKKKVT